MSYRPLPEGLTIKESPVEGLGLFTTKKIKKGLLLGITHIKDNRFEHGYIRTPLGGFINHSINPNVQTIGNGQDREIDFGVLVLQAIRDIEPGEELVLNYTLYKL